MSGVMVDRVRERLEICGFSQAELARRVGIKQPSINRLFQGETQNPRFLHQIARELGTSTSYLLGESDDPSASYLASPRDAYHAPPAPTPRYPDDIVGLRVLDLTFGMGATYLEGPVTEATHYVSRAILRQFTKSDPEHLLFAAGIGDSMAPTILDSDGLLIDTSQKNLNMADKIWAAAYADCGTIKRLRPVPGGGVLMMADNPSVPDATAYDGELHLLGRVVGIMRKV